MLPSCVFLCMCVCFRITLTHPLNFLPACVPQRRCPIFNFTHLSGALLSAPREPTCLVQGPLRSQRAELRPLNVTHLRALTLLQEKNKSVSRHQVACAESGFCFRIIFAFDFLRFHILYIILIFTFSSYLTSCLQFVKSKLLFTGGTVLAVVFTLANSSTYTSGMLTPMPTSVSPA